MIEIKTGKEGEILLAGRFDASQVDKAREVFDAIETTCVVDLENLSYISSGGLSVLLATEKRLREGGQRLRLRNMSSHILELFQYAGLDQIFQIE
jgi:anti-anti-sigma factor